MTKPDGGAAKEFVEAFRGMTLRDHFAGLAIHGQTAGDGEFDDFKRTEDLAAHAYRVADAMLAERSKGGGG